MTKPFAEPGHVFNVLASATTWEAEQVMVLLKTPNVVIINLLIPSGSTVPTYEAEGEIIIHCLSGHVAVTALGKAHELKAHQLLYLAQGAAFAIRGVENASVLATIVTPKDGGDVELIGEH